LTRALSQKNVRILQLLLYLSSLIGCAPHANLTPAAILISESLEGSSWSLLSYRNKGEELTGLMLQTSYTIQFDSKTNLLRGRIDCNFYDGNYSASGQKINLSLENISERACPMMREPGYNQQTNSILSILQGAAFFQIQDESLIIKTKDNAILRFSLSN